MDASQIDFDDEAIGGNFVNTISGAVAPLCPPPPRSKRDQFMSILDNEYLLECT
jgi:hypothetical protein